MVVAGEKLLTNLRFADDIVWVAQSKQAAKSMRTDLNREWNMAGLKLHTGKTQVMCKGFGKPPTTEHIDSGEGGRVQILELWTQRQTISAQLCARHMDWSWCKGHTGVLGNEVAARMADWACGNNDKVWQSYDKPSTMQPVTFKRGRTTPQLSSRALS